MKDKKEFRIYAKSIQKQLDLESLSKIAVKKIRSFSGYKKAKNVMLYYPLPTELDLRDLFKDNKRFYLPKVSGKTLLVCPYCESLIKSDFNIMEPDTTPVEPSELDLIIVPALMADKNCYRLGHGGGFYDRFLSTCNIPTVTVLPKELVCDELPHEEYDIKVNKILKM